MNEFIKVLLEAQVDKLCIVTGLILLFISVVGKIKDWFDPGTVGRVLALCIGGGLLMTGLGLWASSESMKRNAPGGTQATHVSGDSNKVPSDDPIVEPPPSPRIRVSGTYRGTERSVAGLQANLQLQLQQYALQVGRTYSNTLGDYGVISGTVVGSSVSGRAVSNAIADYYCDFQASLTNGGASMSGQFACSSGDRGTFSLNR